MQMECKNPATIANDLANSVCVKKVKSSFYNLFVLGILAGVFIGFGAWLATVIGHDMGANMGLGMTKFMMGAVFSVGLMLVVIAGAELFTGNNLIVLSVLDGKSSFAGLLRNWGIVYFANLIGSVLLALFIYWSGLWHMGGDAVGVFSLKIASAKVDLPFWQAFFRAIGCNWLVCLAVWMAISSRDTVGKVFAIFFPIMAFVASGFEHSVANMFFIPMGMLLKSVGLAGVTASGNLNLFGFLVSNEIPVTLGNIVGGAFFIADKYITGGMTQLRFGSLTRGETLTRSRIGGWRAIKFFMMEYPLGAGLSRHGSAGTLFLGQLESLHIPQPDNYYAMLLSDLGIPGAIIMLAIIFSLIYKGIKSLKFLRDTELAYAAAAIIALFITLMIQSWGSMPLTANPYTAYFWFLAGVLIKIPLIDRKNAGDHELVRPQEYAQETNYYRPNQLSPY